jgi:hypothetical protein
MTNKLNQTIRNYFFSFFDEGKKKNEVIQKALELITLRIHENRPQKKYNFYVQTQDPYQFINITLFTSASKSFDVTHTSLLSFEDIKDVFADDSSKEENSLQEAHKFTIFNDECCETQENEEEQVVQSKSKVSNSPSETKTTTLVPTLYRPTASLEWLKTLQSLLDQSSDLRWVKKLSEGPFIDSLSDPATDYEAVFKAKVPLYKINGQNNTTLQKVVGWIIFIQKILEIEDIKSKINMIHKYSLGKVINQCASLLYHVPLEMVDDLMPHLAGQINLMATQILETISIGYFESLEWQEALQKLMTNATTPSQQPMREKTLETILNYKEASNRTYVTAWDLFKNRLMISMSGRLMALAPENIQKWKTLRHHCKESLPYLPLFFNGALFLNEITAQILSRIASAFSHFCSTNPDVYWPNNLLVSKTVKGNFVNLLVTLMNIRSDFDNRKTVLSVIHRLLDSALPTEKWNRLFHLIQNDHISEEEMLSIVMDGKATNAQLAAMSVSFWFCGEGKIALDCCVELGSYSRKQLQNLPKTLGARLSFSAVQFREKQDEEKAARIGKHQVSYLKICQRCQETWPIFEALYWSLRKTGINMLFLDNLQKVITQRRNS